VKFIEMKTTHYRRLSMEFSCIALAVVLCGCASQTKLQRSIPNTQITPRHVDGSKPVFVGEITNLVEPGIVIGRYRCGWLNIEHQQYAWESDVLVEPSEFKLAAMTQLRESGFDVIEAENNLVTQQDPQNRRYRLDATIKNIKMNLFGYCAGTFSEAAVEVEWKLQDLLNGGTPLVQTTCGYAREEGLQNGMFHRIIPSALRNALLQLVATSNLADVLSKNKREPQ
jgi:hypothetical protein